MDITERNANELELAKKIADFISKYGDEYEIQDQLESDETREEFFEQLVEETATYLKSSEGAEEIDTYLVNFKDYGDEEAVQIASQLIDAVEQTYAFQLGNTAKAFASIQIACDDEQSVREGVAYHYQSFESDANAEGVYQQIMEDDTIFRNRLTELIQYQLETPKGRAEAAEALEGYLQLADEDAINVNADYIESTMNNLKALNDYETETEFIARIAAAILPEEPDAFFQKIASEFDNSEVRNELVAKLEDEVNIETGDLTLKIESPNIPNEFNAAYIIQAICDYEEKQLLSQNALDSEPRTSDFVKAMIQTVMQSPSPVDDESHGRTFYSIGNYDAVKRYDENTDINSVMIFRDKQALVDITIQPENAEHPKLADVTFIDKNFSSNDYDNLQVARIADELSKYLAEPEYWAEYQLPQDFEHLDIETIHDNDNVEIALDRVLIPLATSENNLIFTNGREVAEQADSVNFRADYDTEQLFISFSYEGKEYEAEIPLTPNEKRTLSNLDEADRAYLSGETYEQDMSDAVIGE